MKHLINSYLLSFTQPMVATLNALIMKKQLSGYSYNHYYEIVRDCVQGMHQRRLKTASVNQATTTLVNDGIISKHYNSFEDLYDDVNRLIGRIPGIGGLTVYDTAFKLGCTMNPRLFPKDKVYLMGNSPYKAACKYYGRKLNHIEPISTFAADFGEIPSMFIEDFFCVMSRYITGPGTVKTVYISDIKKSYRNYCCTLI